MTLDLQALVDVQRLSLMREPVMQLAHANVHRQGRPCQCFESLARDIGERGDQPAGECRQQPMGGAVTVAQVVEHLYQDEQTVVGTLME
jgi:hypothetical protein